MGLALVLDPEVDVWLWTRTDHTARALGWPSWQTLQDVLERDQAWPEGEAKPPRPKETAEWALRQQRKPRSSTVYRQVAQTVGLGRCADPALQALRQTLQRWFPQEGA